MLVTAFITLVLDLYTKHLAIVYLRAEPENYIYFDRYVQIIPGFFDLTFARNTGGAFSFMHTRPWVIGLIATAMITGILIWVYRMPQRQRIVQFAFGLIIGGAIGNLIDRARFGYVVDFLDFYYVSGGMKHAWPTFNVADIAIVCGIILFMYLTLFTKIFDPPAKPAESETETETLPSESS